MPEFLMPAARCLDTRQRIKSQALDGRRYTQSQSTEVWLISQSLADDLTARTRQQWQADPITYTGN